MNKNGFGSRSGPFLQDWLKKSLFFMLKLNKLWRLQEVFNYLLLVNSWDFVLKAKSKFLVSFGWYFAPWIRMRADQHIFADPDPGSQNVANLTRIWEIWRRRMQNKSVFNFLVIVIKLLSFFTVEPPVCVFSGVFIFQTKPPHLF